jgi:7-cyano-7-deazaguanine reductase
MKEKIHPSWDTSGYEGRQDHIRDLKIEPPLETIENMYPDRDYTVELTTEEFSSICPKTGLPDFAKLVIRYIPDRYLVEEKSLKLYLTGYRNVGIFQEHATNKILDDFVRTVKPRYVQIVAYWNSRGGIATTVTIEWKKG